MSYHYNRLSLLLTYNRNPLRRCVTWSLLSLLWLCNQAQAVGVSDITLHSKLGEPLRATLRITDAGDLSKEQLIVRIPSQQVFKQLGVERKYDVLNMKFERTEDHSVMITTHDSIKEPYLHFVIEVLWPEGQLYREYKLFLDPV